MAGMATHVRSFSKINLGLAIGPARADGFHGLTTMYQTLALHDVVTVVCDSFPRDVDCADFESSVGAGGQPEYGLEDGRAVPGADGCDGFGEDPDPKEFAGAGWDGGRVGECGGGFDGVGEGAWAWRCRGRSGWSWRRGSGRMCRCFCWGDRCWGWGGGSRYIRCPICRRRCV